MRSSISSSPEHQAGETNGHGKPWARQGESRRGRFTGLTVRDVLRRLKLGLEAALDRDPRLSMRVASRCTPRSMLHNSDLLARPRTEQLSESEAECS